MSREYDLGYLFARERAKGAGVADLDAHLGDMQREAPESKRCVNMLDGKGNRCFGSVLVVKEPEEEPKPGEKRKKQKLWCAKCLEKKAEENKSKAGQQHKADYRDANREELNEKNAERKEDRRNDPKLHAHDQQVNAEWRANNAEHIAEVSAEYRANNAEKIKNDMDAWNRSEAAKVSKADYRDANREVLNEKNAERKEERRNDPKLHAHDQQVGAEYRAEHQEGRKEYMDAWNKSESAKVCKATYKLTPKGIEAAERYRRSAKGLESNKRYREKHREALKAKQDEWNHSPMGLLVRALYKMVKGEHWNPQSFPSLGSFASNDEAKAHFEERFEPWMSWENQGRHIKGNEYNDTWNIGHALPRKIFNQWEQEDLRRCWHPDNLFPQCARQNTELRDALIYTDAELLTMRHLWPVGANDDLEQLKGLFQFVDHDFIRSKLPVEAGPSGLNDGFVSDDASSTSG